MLCFLHCRCSFLGCPCLHFTHFHFLFLTRPSAGKPASGSFMSARRESKATGPALHDLVARVPCRTGRLDARAASMTPWRKGPQCGCACCTFSPALLWRGRHCRQVALARLHAVALAGQAVRAGGASAGPWASDVGGSAAPSFGRQISHGRFRAVR